MNMNDFFIRRTGRLYFEREKLQDLIKFITSYAEKLFEWNELFTEREKKHFEKAFKQAISFTA